MKRIRVIQISNGVGSGNIGDELMAQEFWRLLPGNVVLDVAVLPEASRYRGGYPAPHRYVDAASPPDGLFDLPGLLVGDTPVAEFEGLRYPLQTVGPAISRVTRSGQPVDAIAVGVDRLHSAEGRQLFAAYYGGIRSWTVRSEACREALLDLGIGPERIHVAADLAWLFTPGTETDEWAAGVWRELGVDTGRQLLVVNAVHHADPTAVTDKQAVAAALDQLAFDHGYQIAFLHNESRTGPYYDAAATTRIRAYLRAPAVEVPTEYYTPQEMVSLLRSATTVLSQRYHMAIQAILAGTVPVCLTRGQKLSGLAREFDLPTAALETSPIVDSVRQAAARRPERLAALARKREEHRLRAGEALHFFRQYLSESAPTPKAAVQQVAVIHLGGLGDLVLASSLLTALRQRYGQAEIHLLCRASFAKLTELFPSPPDRVTPIRLDPNGYREPGGALTAALRELDGQIGGLRPDVVVSAELEPSWISWYLASRWQAPLNVACTRIQAPLGLLPQLLREAGWAPVEFAGPAWQAELVEGDRYAALARELGVAECPTPLWRQNPEQQRQAADFLAGSGIRGSYAICFPLGAASTLVKRWSPESFAAVLAEATDQFALPVLLTGEAHERSALEAQAEALRSRGATVAVFAGTVDDLALLAGLLAGAAFFLGNDTGPAHLAQAYGTPGAVVFGGGTWPHYRPWGPGAVGVVHPLPCFGCRWDCVFGRPVCIEGVTVEAVVRALAQGRANPAGAAEVIAIRSTVADSVVGLAKVWRTAADERLIKLEELSQTHEQVSAAAASRADALHELDQRLRGAETNREQVQIAAEHRLELIQTISNELSELRTQNAARLQALENADQLLRRQDEEIEELRAGYAARLIAIEEANALLRRQQDEIAELREGHAARLVAIEEANVLLRKQQDEIAELREGHAARLVAIEEANVLLRKQQDEIAELREGHAARLVAIEEANALLRKQQDEIAELREGHAARLVAIEEANALLRKQQDEMARHAGRSQELETAAAERLAALEQANQLLSAANIAKEAQDQRLRVFEQAAVDRLAALETTAAALRTEGARRAQLAADLQAAAEAQAEARRQQAGERQRWETVLEELRAEVSRERGVRLSADEQLAALRAELARVEADRDRYRRSTEELALSEQELRGQILAAESETLLQSVFRKVRGKSN